MEVAPTLWAVAAIMAFIFYPIASKHGTTGYALFGAAMVVMLVLIRQVGGLSFMDAGMRASVARDIAAYVGGDMQTGTEQIWGGKTAQTYRVTWQHESRDCRLTLDVSGTIAHLAVAAQPVHAVTINTFDDGRLVSESDNACAVALLDESVREILERIERLGARKSLSVDIDGNGIRIYKHAPLSPTRTREFIDLCYPVFSRALQVCYNEK